MDTPNFHCGEYWCGPVCRRCGHHFNGKGAISTFRGQDGISDAKTSKRRKKPHKGFDKCICCGTTIDNRDKLVASLMCEKCQAPRDGRKGKP